NDVPPRLQQKLNAKRFHQTCYQLRVRFARRNLLLRVSHSKPTAKIQITQLNPFCTQLRNETNDAPQRLAERLKIRNLRTDVRADAVPAHPLLSRIFLVQRKRTVPVESEFVLVSSG